MIIKKTIVVVLTLLAFTANADINRNQPPFSLTLAQLEQWTPDSKFADKNNISTVALNGRFVAELGNTKQSLDSEVKVLIAPDGMNNFANYLTEQDKFNLYNFTHWAHIDVLNWFAGTANETVSLPARPWVETAHRNGVKVIGTVYLSVAQYGGNVETVARLLQQDENGDFPLANKLVAIADYYGFDGWLINPETNLTFVKNAQGEVIKGEFEYQNAAILGKKMQTFMKYLTRIAPEEMEIHWYDSMLLDGSVKWQNELNQKNAPFLQQDSQRFSDAMFMNYWWDRDMVEGSRDYVQTLGRSRYDLYFGADLSPARNAQRMFEQKEWLYALFPEQREHHTGGDKGQGNRKALSSIALFGNDVNFTFTGNKHTKAFSNFRQDALDHQRFYDTETKLFAGNDLNLYRHDDNNDWPGLGRFVPAKSTLMDLPFSTSFNTGHGFFKANKGQVMAGQWHDMSQQDLLPTWQFAIKGNPNTSVFYDFGKAYQGGSSLAIITKKHDIAADIPLYASSFLLSKDSQLSITYQYQSEQGNVSLWLMLDNGNKVTLALDQVDLTDMPEGNWQTSTIPLRFYQNRTVTKIGFTVEKQEVEQVAINIGLLEIM